MRITGDNVDGVLAPQTSRVDEISTASQGARLKESRLATDTGDSVEISSLSARVMETAAADEARVSARVSELAKLYSRGDYNPDSATLSRTLVSHALSGSVEEGS